MLFTNFAQMMRFAFRTYALYALPFQVLIPALILATAAIRGLKTGDEPAGRKVGDGARRPWKGGKAKGAQGGK